MAFEKVEISNHYYMDAMMYAMNAMDAIDTLVVGGRGNADAFKELSSRKYYVNEVCIVDCNLKSEI